MDKSIRKQLPKTRLITLQWSWDWFYFAKFRGANSLRLQIWWLTITFRAPWLEHSARALYPHLFRREG